MTNVHTYIQSIELRGEIRTLNRRNELLEVTVA